jgi:ribulose-5-phosphate 4-epimerase/fuculose-1-phosphate aldolase
MEKFLNYSRIIGSNILLSQGPGGNTSTKKNGEIFIKKTGKYLIDSVNKDTFQKVDLTKIENFYIKEKSDKKYLKSLSIETPIHVMLKDRHIFHYHSVASIIISIIFQEKIIIPFLNKNKMTFIPYKRPGFELAVEITKNYNKDSVNVFFLKNHGMIVAGNNLEKVYKQINQSENAFKSLLDYGRLKKIFQATNFIRNDKRTIKIKNLSPNLNFERFNDLYFFPDHAVFASYNFQHISKTRKTSEKLIYFDSDYLYLNFKLNTVEEIYMKLLLSIYFYIEENKLIGYISKKDGVTLKGSKDEKQRIEINK